MNTTLLTRREKAHELGISLRTFDRWQKKGKISGAVTVPNGSRKFYFPENNNINLSIELQPNN